MEPLDLRFLGGDVGAVLQAGDGGGWGFAWRRVFRKLNSQRLV